MYHWEIRYYIDTRGKKLKCSYHFLKKKKIGQSETNVEQLPSNRHLPIYWWEIWADGIFMNLAFWLSLNAISAYLNPSLLQNAGFVTEKK